MKVIVNTRRSVVQLQHYFDIPLRTSSRHMCSFIVGWCDSVRKKGDDRCRSLFFLHTGTHHSVPYAAPAPVRVQYGNNNLFWFLSVGKIDESVVVIFYFAIWDVCATN